MNERLRTIWRAAEARPDFAERVLVEVHRARATRRRSAAIAAACATLVAAALLLWLWPTPTSRSSSSVSDVEQAAGIAFYRVETGETIVVHTPAAQIIADGAHFSVEVIPMKREIVSALAGAAVAATVVVVYRGTVTARSNDQTITASGGESLRLGDSAGAPATASAADVVAEAKSSATREQLLVRDRLLVKRIVGLSSKVRELEAKLAAQAAPGEAAATAGPDRKKFLDLSDSELGVLADRCEIRYDIPAYAMANDVTRILDRVFGDADVSDVEREILTEVMKSGDPTLVALMRDIYIEVTGDRAGADSLSPRNMQHEVFDKSAPGDLREALRLISAERAKRLQPPEDVSSRPPIERLLRALAASGARLEAAIAAQLGAERAHELRLGGVGWARRGQSGCPSE